MAKIKYFGRGKLSNDELNAILQMIPEDKPFQMMEIGTLCGRSAAWLCDRRPMLKLLSIDIFVSATWKDYAANKRPNMALFWGTVREWRQYAPDVMFDLIFIDGDHTYAGVKEDLDVCHHLQKGRLILHDFNDKKYPGLVRAVQEYAAKCECGIYPVQQTLVEVI